MTPRHFRQLVALLMGLAVAVYLAPAAFRFVAFERATRRPVTQFRASSTDPRVRYEPGAEAMAELAATSLPEALETVERMQFAPITIPVEVYVCASLESFGRYSTSPRSGGITLNHRIFLSPKPENTAERLPAILTHELSHLQLGQKLSDYRFARLPVWFEEGLAVEVSNGGGGEGVSGRELRKEIAAGISFLPEPEGSLMHRKGAHAYGLEEHMFYGQAGMFIGYLRSVDEGHFRAFLLAVEDGKALGAAFEGAYGVPLDSAWRDFVAKVKAAPAT